MKILRLFGILTLATVLLVGSVGSVLAQEAEVTGVIVDVNTVLKTITIAPKGGGTEITLDLTGIDITKDGESAKIKDLSEGDRVDAVYDPETNQAVNVVAESPPRGSFGITNTVSIGATGEGSFLLETKWGAMEVFVTENTTYHIPTVVPPWQTWAVLGEVLEDGDHVAILFTEPAASHIAQRIMVLPHSPVNDHTVGIIIEVADNTVTIEDKEGNEVTIDIPEGVSVEEVGKFVTIISKKQRGRNPMAKAVERVERVIERLNRHMEKAEARVAKGEIDEEEGSKDIERLKGLLQANHERHYAVLERVSNKFEARFAPEHPARLAIERAKENAKKGYEKAREAIEKGKGESKPEGAGPPEGKGKPE